MFAKDPWYFHVYCLLHIEAGVDAAKEGDMAGYRLRTLPIAFWHYTVRDEWKSAQCLNKDSYTNLRAFMCVTEQRRERKHCSHDSSSVGPTHGWRMQTEQAIFVVPQHTA